MANERSLMCMQRLLLNKDNSCQGRYHAAKNSKLQDLPMVLGIDVKFLKKEKSKPNS